MSNEVSLPEWVNLMESQYGKVIFTDVSKEYKTSADMECHYEISDDVVCTPEDYVGVFIVGFKDLKECVVSTKITNIDSTKESITFSAQDLPSESKEYYQFLYVGKNNIIYGASTPFLFSGSSESSDVTDDDFLIIETPTDSKVVPLSVHKEVLVSVAKLEEINAVTTELRLAAEDALDKYKKESEEKLKAKSTELTETLIKMRKTNKCETRELVKQIDTLISENNLLSSKIKEMRQLTDNLMQSNNIMTDKLRVTIEEKNDLLREMEKLTEKMQDIALENKNYALENEVLKQESSCYVEKIAQLERNHGASRVEVSTLASSLESENQFHVKQLEDFEAMLRAMEESKRLCLEELKKEKKWNAKILNEMAHLKQENALLKHTQKMQAKMKEDSAQYKTEAEAANKKVEELDGQIVILQLKDEQLQSSMASLRSQLEALSAHNSSLEESLQCSTANLIVSEANVSDLKESLTESAELYKKQYTSIHGLKREIKKLQKLEERKIQSAPASVASASSSTESSLTAEMMPVMVNCPSCPQQYAVHNGCNLELEDHLLAAHSQQLCPICGMLFDSNLPAKLIECHIDTHFQ